MSWGSRKHPSDSGIKNEYGSQPCPRCGKSITTNAWGRKSHIKSCLQKDVVVRGKLFKAIKFRAGND